MPRNWRTVPLGSRSPWNVPSGAAIKVGAARAPTTGLDASRHRAPMPADAVRHVNEPLMLVTLPIVDGAFVTPGARSWKRQNPRAATPRAPLQALAQHGHPLGSFTTRSEVSSPAR